MHTSTFTILRISSEAYDEIKQRIKDVDDSIGDQLFSYTDEYVLNEGTKREVIRFTKSEVALQAIDEEISEANRHRCAWREDEDGSWWSDCDNGFIFNDAGPYENDFKFCPYCGEKITVNLFRGKAEQQK